MFDKQHSLIYILTALLCCSTYHLNIGYDSHSRMLRERNGLAKLSERTPTSQNFVPQMVSREATAWHMLSTRICGTSQTLWSFLA